MITITTLSGEKVTAQVEHWVMALVLRLEPEDLLKVMKMVTEIAPSITPAPGPLPADPEKFMRLMKGNH